MVKYALFVLDVQRIIACGNPVRKKPNGDNGQEYFCQSDKRTIGSR